MPFFKVRPGQQLAHNGQVLDEGSVLEIPAHVGLEVAGKVDPCTAKGESLVHLSAAALVVAQAPASARITLVQQQVADLRQQLADAEARLAEEEAALAPPVVPSKK